MHTTVGSENKEFADRTVMAFFKRKFVFYGGLIYMTVTTKSQEADILITIGCVTYIKANAFKESLAVILHVNLKTE